MRRIGWYGQAKKVKDFLPHVTGPATPADAWLIQAQNHVFPLLRSLARGSEQFPLRAMVKSPFRVCVEANATRVVCHAVEFYIRERAAYVDPVAERQRMLDTLRQNPPRLPDPIPNAPMPRPLRRRWDSSPSESGE